MSRRKVEANWKKWFKYIDRINQLTSHGAVTGGMEAAYNAHVRAYNKRVWGKPVADCADYGCVCCNGADGWLAQAAEQAWGGADVSLG